MIKRYSKSICFFVKNYIKAIILMVILLSFTGCHSKERLEPIAEERQTVEADQKTVDEQTVEEKQNKEAEQTVDEDQNTGGEQQINEEAPISSTVTTKPVEEAIPTAVLSMINSTGMTMDTRINAPEGYTRIPSEQDGFTGFLRSLKLKEDDSEVLLYDGTPAAYQEGHAAVFNLDIGSRNLQQCADSVIRIYAEYYWSNEEYDKIAFHLTNGFMMKYTKWREGYRLNVNGNDVSWVKKSEYNDSYEGLRNYLNAVFTYAGTLSLSTECKQITRDEILPGDLFLYGGSPGHCVLVVDEAEDEKGNRCYLLAQGYMPAQDFHILNNPLHTEDPWYYASEITYPFITPQYTFEEGSLVRWNDFH